MIFDTRDKFSRLIVKVCLSTSLKNRLNAVWVSVLLSHQCVSASVFDEKAQLNSSLNEKHRVYSECVGHVVLKFQQLYSHRFSGHSLFYANSFSTSTNLNDEL
jgi:hypothetical protein